MIEIILNSEKDGIEIKFDSKPDGAILSALKENGFRWHNQKKVWYAKNTDERMEFVKQLDSEKTTTKAEKVKIAEYDLWEMTRVNSIGNNVDKKLMTKEIAAKVRKHIKDRFPMCRFSVTSDYSSLYAKILSSPFAKDSQELEAIVEYVYRYAESYKYCTDYNPYGDYGSSYNFFGVYKSNIIDYEYEQREMTVSELNMSEIFKAKKEEFERQEKIREEKEFQERLKKNEEARVEAEKQRKIDAENHALVENNISKINTVDYFVLGVIEPNYNKLDCVDDYSEIIKEGKFKTVNCRVTKEVYLTKEMYDIFRNQMMDDWSFIEGTGGSQCDDWRINSMTDYNMMSEQERETVEWYSNECVAIFCEDKLMFIVDAQGYSYCRYVLILDEKSKIVPEYKVQQAISEEERESFRESADVLEDVSVGIIMKHSYGDKWNTEKFDEYKEKIKHWIYDKKFKFNVNIVRAITNEDFKVAMYKLLTEVDGIQEQFAMANLENGQKITMIYMSDFGGMVTRKVVFKSFTPTTYAQYDNAVRLVVRPERKRNDYEMVFHKEVIIYNGWIDYPEDLLWEQLSSSNGMSCKRTRFMSCDREQYDVIMDYFAKNGIKPIINTYKPVF